MDEIKPLDYTGIPPGYFKAGFIITEYNCVVEKVIMEMDPYFKQHMVISVTATEDNPRVIIEYLPDVMVYFRCGTKVNTHPNVLVTVDGHIGYFRSLDIPVFYYLDDAFFQANNYAPLKILTNSDELILATNALVDHVVNTGYKRPIHLLKTHMNIPVFDSVPPANFVLDKEKFNILFTSEGRIGTLMLDRICERMSQTPDKYKGVRIVCITSQVGQLRTIINRWRGIEKIYYERVPLMEYYGIFKLADLVLSPGEPGDLNYFLATEDQPTWLASKSCVKYTIAGAAKVPCIASNHLKEYVMAIKHGETGYVADTVEEWMNYIDLLIQDEDKRKEIGNNARRDIETNWNIYDRVEQFTDILKGNSTCKVQ